jgi:aminoglycoside 6'-N-acetyltransferase I
MQIDRATPGHRDVWLRLRCALWPEYTAEELRGHMDTMLDGDDAVAFMADVDGVIVGFAEVSLRRDYVNGCETSPVGFMEGIYVEPDYRTRGVARALVDCAQNWVKEKGCTEFASDALLANIASHKMHNALGFTETERVVYFRKPL